MEELELAFQSIDIDGDGKITKEEMVQWGSLNTQEVNAVFELGDVDRDGAIDITEFCGVMTSCSPVPYTVSLERSPEVITSSHDPRRAAPRSRWATGRSTSPAAGPSAWSGVTTSRASTPRTGRGSWWTNCQRPRAGPSSCRTLLERLR